MTTDPTYVEHMTQFMGFAFKLGHAAGLAEARAHQDGIKDERQRQVDDLVRRTKQWDEDMERTRQKHTRTATLQVDSDHVPAVSMPNMTVYVDPNADAEAVAKEAASLWRTPDPQPSKEPEMAVRTPKSPTQIKEGSALIGDHTTVTYTREPEPGRPQRIGDVVTVTASGRQVQVRLSPTGRKAKVYVDGTEIQSA